MANNKKTLASVFHVTEMTECANPRFEVLVNHKGISVKSGLASVRENMFIRFVFISFCFHFHCCESFQVSKFTISRIAFAIKRFQEQESKRIEWPAMESIAGEAEKNCQ